jgi:DNA-binding SARP family transcriptional activator
MPRLTRSPSHFGCGGRGRVLGHRDEIFRRFGVNIGDMATLARVGDAPVNRSRPVISVGLLGPLAVSVNGCPVTVTARRLRVLLAVLAFSPGRAVSIDRMATAIWSEQDPPANVRRSLQTYLARLRNSLGASAIGSTPTGYLLHADPHHVDVLRFLRLLAEAAQTPDPARERARLADALRLWRGTPFEGVPSAWLEAEQTPWLLERYLNALERRIDLDLSTAPHNHQQHDRQHADATHGALIAELSALTARHPLRESLWARLLIALARSGRRAEALARYETIRRRIATELGTEPDPALQQIHADLLNI